MPPIQLEAQPALPTDTPLYDLQTDVPFMTDIPNMYEMAQDAQSLMQDPNVLRHLSTPDEIYFNVPYKGWIYYDTQCF